MENRVFLSRFSPNRTDPKVLEAIFVQRHKLAEVWLDRLRDSVLTGTKHHLLAIGPRGCGKSHLVSLLISRLRRDQHLVEKVRLAWLPEDETTPSFWKFLLRILRALNAEYGEAFPVPPRERLAGAADDYRTNFLSSYLIERLEGRALLVVVENLDDVMRGLKNEGQKRWRAFLQTHGAAATLATAQQLTEDLSFRDKPFFNFFETEVLRPLTSDEALSLLRKIANYNNNAILVKFLESTTGRARVRAIRHMTGGSHRIFIILSEFATKESLDDLVKVFEELLDELTPYYQERLRWLPDQQREIVEFLCRQARTVAAKEIAAELFLTEQTAGAQLKSLRTKGYVTGETVGRESRYELAEPLMRLCVEVKDPQREPIRLVVEFLRVWYDRAQVENRLQCLPADAELERRYFRAALIAEERDFQSPVQKAFDADVKTAAAMGNTDDVIHLLVEHIQVADAAETCFSIGRKLEKLRRYTEAVDAYRRAVHLDPNHSKAWVWLANGLNRAGKYEAALPAYERAIEAHPTDEYLWTRKGDALNKLRRHDEARATYEHVLKLVPVSSFNWVFRSIALGKLEADNEALSALERAIELDPNSAFAWKRKGDVLIRLKRVSEALIAYERAVELEPRNSFAWTCKADILEQLDRQADAMVAYETAKNVEPNDGYAWARWSQALTKTGQWSEALSAAEQATIVEPGDAYGWTCKGYVLENLGRLEDALKAYEEATRVEPEDSYSWMCRGDVLTLLNRPSEAIAMYTHATTVDPHYDSAWVQSAHVKLAEGDHEGALKDLTHAVRLDPTYKKKLTDFIEKFIINGDWNTAKSAIQIHSIAAFTATDLSRLVAALFRASADPKIWTQRVNFLIRLAQRIRYDDNSTADNLISPELPILDSPTRRHSLAVLANALITSLTSSAYTGASTTALNSWAAIWSLAAEKHPELTLADRLFTTGIRYVQTREERVLTDLVQSERAILSRLFQLDQTTGVD